ncbi:ribosomal RNA small subunit methyltransferase A, partial [Patescibacteria group bacterium]|nr:ribosomal RNA small subunit methyltransferase A [Patescibacteria group bacterium]
MYKNKEELLTLLKKEKLWTQKNLGQNFLINPAILDEILNAANLTNEDYIIEVGPGLGILTDKLLKQAAKVHCIELDPKLIPYLRRTFGHNTGFELEEGTALKANLPDHPYKLVANIPYYITSPLLRHFLNPKDPSQKRPELIVLLVQKEVAQKICAGENDQSILSLNVQIFGKPEIIATVGPANFFPAPKV